jgi:hypothetical protein
MEFHFYTDVTTEIDICSWYTSDVSIKTAFPKNKNCCDNEISWVGLRLLSNLYWDAWNYKTIDWLVD